MRRRCVTHGDSGQCSIDGPVAPSRHGMHTRARARARANMVGDSQSDRRETGPMVSLGPHFMLGRVSNE